jgi:hypothetical protein
VAAAFGVVGGLAFGLASATIPYTDAFDGLSKAAPLLSIWAIVVGVIELRRRTSAPSSAAKAAEGLNVRVRTADS